MMTIREIKRFLIWAAFVVIWGMMAIASANAGGDPPRATDRNNFYPAFGAKPTDPRIPLKYLNPPAPQMNPVPAGLAPSNRIAPTSPVRPLDQIAKAWVLIAEATSAYDAMALLNRTFGDPPWRFEGFDEQTGDFTRVVLHSVQERPPGAPYLPPRFFAEVEFIDPEVTPAVRWVEMAGRPRMTWRARP